MYMSYCRNEGTYQEITACLDAVQERLDDVTCEQMSQKEAHYFVEIIRAVHYFLIENDLVDEFGDLDEDKLEEMQNILEGAD